MDGRQYFDCVRECYRRLPELKRTYLALLDAAESCDRSSLHVESGRGGGLRDETAQAFDDLEVTRKRMLDARAKYTDVAKRCGRFDDLMRTLLLEGRGLIADAMDIWCRDNAATWSDIARELGCSRTTLTTKRNELYRQVSRGDYDRIMSGEVHRK